MPNATKPFWTRLKAACAILLSTILISGAATVLSNTDAAHAAPGPFTCTSDFYQVSAGKMYQYSVASNTYSLMAAGGTAVANLNGIGYNTGDNFIYGIAGGKLYQISNDGSHGAAITLTGVAAQSTGGDFIAPNVLLTTDAAGNNPANPTAIWSAINTSTHVVTAFTATGTTWRGDDIGYNPSNNTVYGMSGLTLYIGVISGTTVNVTTKTVIDPVDSSTDPWGAAYVDSAGDVYFFDNITFNLVEISKTDLASASPTATSITHANSLTTPNDGASCPTASSPLAPTVVTTAATSVTSTTAVLNGTVATGLPASSDVPSGGIVICYSTSATVTSGALSVSPVCGAATPSSLPVNTAATAVTRSVSGLTAGTTYYVQVQATNSYGIAAYANVVSFTTPAASHTVTFDNNGGSGSIANEVRNAATALTTNTFTRAGYTFSGWNSAANGSGTAYADGASYPFTADVTLYAQWTALPTHTVIFNNNGGTGSMANEVNNVATPLTTDTFTRAGFSFTGWNTVAGGGGTSYADSASYPFTADVTLYAQWTALPNHTVIFNNNGGTGAMANEVNNVAAALTADTFTRAGFTFAGWNTVAGGGGTSYANGASYPFTADVTLYAQWTAIPTKTVIFNSNGGTGSMANEVNNVPTALTTDTLTRAGFTFAGWNTAANGSGTSYADGASYAFAADATMFAQWTAIPTKTVIFDSNGGTGSMANEVNNVAAPLTTDTFTRPGFTFAGWNTSANGSGAPYSDGASYGFTVDATMYAQWAPIGAKTVTFDSNGGSGSMADEFNNVPAALSTDTFIRVGFTFAGWNTAANGSGTAYADGDSYDFAADATMFAQWTAIPTKTVTFDSNGGTGSIADEVDNVPTPLTTNSFSRPGFTFAGWNTAANGSGTAYADGDSYDFAADATMFAQWTAIPTKTVTFDSHGGAGSIADEIDNVPTALTSNSFTRAGYTFAGWNTAANGSGSSYADTATYSFAADLTVYAQWTAIPTKTVTFDSNGGTGSMADEVSNVPTALTVDSFTRAGYTFAGWNTAANGSGTAYADAATYPFAVDATMFAQWTAIPTKTVTFNSNGGAGSIANEVNNVPAALTANSFSRAGFTFAGWNTAANGSGTAYADTASYAFAADATMFAQWTAIPTKTVTFNGNGGAGSIADEVDNVPTPLTGNSFSRAGYNFVGWNTAANGSGTSYADTASFPFAVDATMFAQWSIMPVLSFDVNGGTGTVHSLTGLGPIHLPMTTVPRPGFTFIGWNTAPDGSGTEYNLGDLYTLALNDVLYAQFTKATLAATGIETAAPVAVAGWFLLAGIAMVTAVALAGRRRKVARQR